MRFSCTSDETGAVAFVSPWSGSRIGSGEKAAGEVAVAVVRRAIHADGRGERGVALAEVMLRPRAEHRMDDGAALFKAGAHEVLRVRMHADLGGHRADDGDLVGDLRDLGQILGQLIAGLGRDGTARAFRVAGLRVEGIDVAEAALELDEDDALGLAEAGAAREQGNLGGLLGGGEARRQGREDGEAEGVAGAALDKSAALDGIAEKVEVHMDGVTRCWRFFAYESHGSHES